MNTLHFFLVALVTTLLVPAMASAQQPTTPTQNPSAQQNVPQAVQQAERDVERTARRYRIGVHGGVGLDPELIVVAVHGAIGPIFRPAIQFRPSVEVGVGELTTMMAVNLDVLYSFNSSVGDDRWTPYAGAGPTFGLSHRGFETEEGDKVDENGVPTDRSRFDFSDTDFNGGVNFIVGMRRVSGMFFEMRSTAWGVSNVRLLAGGSF